MKALTFNPNSRPTVQMLDIQVMNNNFYRVFVRNTAESYPTGSMAPELHDEARIYMSGAGSMGLFELALTQALLKTHQGLVRSLFQDQSSHFLSPLGSGVSTQ